jgi:hypothetical protein
MLTEDVIKTLQDALRDRDETIKQLEHRVTAVMATTQMTGSYRASNRRDVVIGHVYRHYKGDIYLVLDVVHCSTNGRNDGFDVIYLSLTGIRTGMKHSRDLEEFAGYTFSPEEGRPIPRFKGVLDRSSIDPS